MADGAAAAAAGAETAAGARAAAAGRAAAAVAEGAAAIARIAPGAAAAAPKPREFYQDIAVVSGGPKEKFRLREVFGPDGAVIGYDVFETDKTDHKKKIPDVKRGTVGVRQVKGVSQPGPPVKIQPAAAAP